MIYIQPDGGHVVFCQNGGPIGLPVLAPGKNVYHMVLSTSGQKLVLLEESEPNSPFIALTPLVLYDYLSGKGF